jgi:hypothetical protein
MRKRRRVSYVGQRREDAVLENQRAFPQQVTSLQRQNLELLGAMRLAQRNIIRGLSDLQGANGGDRSGAQATGERISPFAAAHSSTRQNRPRRPGLIEARLPDKIN